MDKPIMKAAFKAAGLDVLEHIMVASSDLDDQLDTIVERLVATDHLGPHPVDQR